MFHDGGNTFALFATSVFKARILALVLVLSEIAIKAYCLTKKTTIDEVLFNRESTSELAYSTFGEYTEFVPTIGEVRGLFNRNKGYELLAELVDFADGDNDIATLAGFMPRRDG